MLGLFERRIPIIFVNTCWWEIVFQFGTLVFIEWRSSSSFILASKRLSVTSVAIVRLMDL